MAIQRAVVRCEPSLIVAADAAPVCPPNAHKPYAAHNERQLSDSGGCFNSRQNPYNSVPIRTHPYSTARQTGVRRRHPVARHTPLVQPGRFPSARPTASPPRSTQRFYRKLRMLVTEPGLLTAGVLPGCSYYKLFKFRKFYFAIQITGNYLVPQRLMGGRTFQ